MNKFNAGDFVIYEKEKHLVLRVSSDDKFNYKLYSHRRDFCMWASESAVSEVPKPVEVDCWLNVYPASVGVWDSRESSDRWADDARVACIHLKRTVNVGEGL